MAISFGPKLGLLYNSLIGESYFDSLRLFLQSVDQLINGSVINATQISPPSSPNPGDAYLLIGGTPGGVWTGQSGNIAVWDAQLTSSGTNNVVPGWIFLIPQAGWIVYNVATATFLGYSSGTWGTLGGGANFPTNTDITSMTGIPNTVISTSGYAYNDGTDPETTIGATWQYGAGSFGAGLTAQVANQNWGEGVGFTDLAVGVSSSTEFSIISANNGISTSEGVTANSLKIIGEAAIGSILVGSTGTGNIETFSVNQTLSLGGNGISTKPVSVLINSGQVSPVNGVGLLGFDAQYYTQTTVGAAGSASALPALPKGYLQFVAPDGSICVFPYYAAS